jgi:hypothetical protein
VEPRGGYKLLDRRSPSQFLNKTDDPRLSMLRRFAKAMGIELQEPLGKPKKESRKGIEPQ